MTAKDFISALSELKSEEHKLKNKRHVHACNETDNQVLGVRMKFIFDTAKEFQKMSIEEIEKLFDSEHYEVRMGAVCIMDFQARSKKISDEKHKVLFDLYLKKHNRITNWDMVDRAATHVIGKYLFDKNRDPLFELAKSNDLLEQRSSILATLYFVKNKDFQDALKLYSLLLSNQDELVQKPIGTLLRTIGDQDQNILFDFIESNLGRFSQVALRYALEKVPKEQRKVYLEQNKSESS